jgi:glycine oxidase
MKHFLIVGGGIAGTSLAFHLLERACTVTLVDAGYNHSSLIAAGQINPLVFRRMTKSWRVDEFLPYARAWYEKLEEESGTNIIIDKIIRRMFAHEQEKQEWINKQDLPEFTEYLNHLTETDLNFEEAINICGSGRVKQSFYVHSERFLKAMKTIISNHKNGCWKDEKIDFGDLNPANTSCNGKPYDGIIFCTGFENDVNPYFQLLKVEKTKGEVLTISSDMYDEESLNRKCFVLPNSDGQFRIGSNYEWNAKNVETSEQVKKLILENLQSLVPNEFEVLDHVAGIRPTVKDRRPLMGEHPDIPGFYAFNGLGAKGYMMAPLLGKEMVEFILDGKELDREVDLTRCISK